MGSSQCSGCVLCADGHSSARAPHAQTHHDERERVEHTSLDCKDSKRRQSKGQRQSGLLRAASFVHVHRSCPVTGMSEHHCSLCHPAGQSQQHPAAYFPVTCQVALCNVGALGGFQKAHCLKSLWCGQGALENHRGVQNKRLPLFPGAECPRSRSRLIGLQPTASSRGHSRSLLHLCPETFPGTEHVLVVLLVSMCWLSY